MLQFTRHAITGGLVIEPEHVVQPDECFIFIYRDVGFTLGVEPYSLVICPHYKTDAPWHIEGLRTIDDTEDGDINEIWFVGTMEACIAEFERITSFFRSQGYQINEPDNYDFESVVRGFHKSRLDLPPPWNV